METLQLMEFVLIEFIENEMATFIYLDCLTVEIE